MTRMDRPHLRSQSILDFSKWQEAHTLILSPKFQRRRIWPPKAKSYLIDTILRGFPIPKIYMRQQLDLKSKEVIHEVVDGQQRIATALEFYSGGFRINKAHGEFAGLKFAQLPDSVKAAFLGYEFSVDLLVEAADKDVLDIFARINSYSVPLNAQEKRNAKYFGAFKQCAYRLGWDHLEFWKKHNILSDQAVARMREAELTSELLVAMLMGLQDKKKSLDGYYQEWDESFPHEVSASNQFRAVIDTIENLFGESLTRTNFRRPALFYSLFLVVHSLRFGPETAEGRRILSKTNASNARIQIQELSDAIDAEIPPSRFAKFVAASQRQTDNLIPRRRRHQTILAALKR